MTACEKIFLEFFAEYLEQILVSIEASFRNLDVEQLNRAQRLLVRRKELLVSVDRQALNIVLSEESVSENRRKSTMNHSE